MPSRSARSAARCSFRSPRPSSPARTGPRRFSAAFALLIASPGPPRAGLWRGSVSRSPTAPAWPPTAAAHVSSRCSPSERSATPASTSLSTFGASPNAIAASCRAGVSTSWGPGSADWWRARSDGTSTRRRSRSSSPSSGPTPTSTIAWTDEPSATSSPIRFSTSTA